MATRRPLVVVGGELSELPSGDMLDPTTYVAGGSTGGVSPAPIGPEITRTGDLVTRIDYDGGEYKIFTYTGSRLDRIDFVHGDATAGYVDTLDAGGDEWEDTLNTSLDIDQDYLSVSTATTRKDLVYTDGLLTAINQTEI
jgi:hypothetical protein